MVAKGHKYRNVPMILKVLYYLFLGGGGGVLNTKQGISRDILHCKESIPKNRYKYSIPRKGIAWPQSQFLHSCVCEQFTYSHHRSAYSSSGNMWTDPGNK
jgi:hypothetical protein